MRIPDFVDSLNDSLKNGTAILNETIYPYLMLEVIAGK
jgi:hypothetical protein